MQKNQDEDLTERIWMCPSGHTVEPPFFAVFRNRFRTGGPARLRFRFSADERAAFFLNGEKIADGPERGTPGCWFYETVDVPVPAGEHVLTARLFAFGNALTAYGQMSVRPGLWVEDCSGLLGTWECQVCRGCAFAGSATDWGSYAHLLTDETFNWEALDGRGGQWVPPALFPDCRRMAAGTLPPMRYDEITAWVRKDRYFLFENYVCAYGDYVFSGTGEVRLRWAEPGCRPENLDDAFRNGCKPGDSSPYFSGPGDRFILTGGRIRFQDYWWHAGRSLEMTLFGDVRLEEVHFYQTGYPWTLRRQPRAADNPRMNRLLEHCWNTLQACSFETLMDCPYYEQLQYISDSRFDLLALYELSDDLRLPEKCLKQLAEGQFPSGMYACRYPAKDYFQTVFDYGRKYRLKIPVFSAFYIQMLHDFARLRKNDRLVAGLLPSVRRAAEYFAGTLGEDGLLHVPGWNFIDWIDSWDDGVPPECGEGCGCTLNLVFILSLLQLADLERVFGDPAGQEHYTALAGKLGEAVRKNYYLENRQCYAENRSGNCVTEHAQVFALLALEDRSVIPALRSGTLPECGIAFSFYYLEACRVFGLEDLFARRRERYYETAEFGELRTMPELFPNSWWLRSDCHAWGAHFLYHYFAAGSILDPVPAIDHHL